MGKKRNEGGQGSMALPEYEIGPDETVDVCPNCLKCFKQNPRGRRKKFCSEKCRTAWNHKYVDPSVSRASSRTVVCPECGKEFTAVREYGHLRKYCSHACANRGRAVERKNST